MIGVGDGLRRGAWMRRGVRRRGSHRKRHVGARQMAIFAKVTAAKWAARNEGPGAPVYAERHVDAPFRDDHGRAFWYPLEIYPVGSTIESTVQAGGKVVHGLGKFAEGRRGGVAGFIMLRHIDPFRRPIACTNERQARIEAERHGYELADGPGAR